MYLGYNKLINRETINIYDVRIMKRCIKPTLLFTMIFSAVLFGREKEDDRGQDQDSATYEGDELSCSFFANTK